MCQIPTRARTPNTASSCQSKQRRGRKVKTCPAPGHVCSRNVEEVLSGLQVGPALVDRPLRLKLAASLLVASLPHSHEPPVARSVSDVHEPSDWHASRPRAPKRGSRQQKTPLFVSFCYGVFSSAIMPCSSNASRTHKERLGRQDEPGGLGPSRVRRPGTAGERGMFEKLFADAPPSTPMHMHMPHALGHCGCDGELGRECLNAPVCRMMLDGAEVHSATDGHVRQEPLTYGDLVSVAPRIPPPGLDDRALRGAACAGTSINGVCRNRMSSLLGLRLSRHTAALHHLPATWWFRAHLFAVINAT